MTSFKENLGFHASALHLRSRRNDMLASNIANAATPNFKARDLDFDSELKRINKIRNVTSTNNRHFSSIQKRIGQDSVFRLPIHPSLANILGRKVFCSWRFEFLVFLWVSKPGLGQAWAKLGESILIVLNSLVVTFILFQPMEQFL